MQLRFCYLEQQQQQKSAILGMNANIRASLPHVLKTGSLCGRLVIQTKHLSGKKLCCRTLNGVVTVT